MSTYLVSVKKTVSIVAMSVCNITSSKIKEDSPKNDPRNGEEDRNLVTYVNLNASSSQIQFNVVDMSRSNKHVNAIKLN